MWRDRFPEQAHVALREDLKKYVEFYVHDGHFLQLSQSNLAKVEVHSSHGGTLDNVVQGITPRRGDGDDVIRLIQIKHTVVHSGILSRIKRSLIT